MLSEIGLILVVGLLGTRVLKKLHIPKVLGFIIIGYLIGLVNRSIFPFMQTDMVNVITPHIIKEKSQSIDTSKRFSAGYLSSIYNLKSDSQNNQKTISSEKIGLKSDLSSNNNLTKGD